MQTKTEQILDYLKKGNELTGIEAVDMFKTTGLARYIKDLRDEGYQISTDLKTNENTGKTYGVYKLVSTDIKAISELILDARRNNQEGKTEDAKTNITKAISLINNFVQR